MSFLVLSDLHANATALAAALSASQGRWERAVCLGDLVGYGPDPNEVVDQLRGIATTVIRGNHDRAASGLTDLEAFNPVAGTSLLWTRNNLSPANRDYLCALPSGPIETGGVALVHGSVRDEDEYIFSPAQALDSLLTSPASVTFFGHTHFQGGFSYRESRLEMIQLKPKAGSSFAALQLEK